ncbi:hypothetical protein [Saccharothrix sp. NRRL B-16314]|uniref:hypothetical protein n=1 Tax=Saccharothrix sp. NRRL B-16314 TaxID=1463825 RepID=UPI0005264826|nr:hypothetical protein [Saccharothrix sp. NRRL B-16314]
MGLVIQIVVAFTGIATVIANVILISRTIDVSREQQQLAARLADEQKQVTKVYQTLTKLSGAYAPDDQDKFVVQLQLYLQNIGDKAVRGCSTRTQLVGRDLAPVKYWPSILEPGAVLWNLVPGETHVTEQSTWYLRSREGDDLLVELWFECEYPKTISRSTFIRLNLASGRVEEDTGISRDQPMDSYDRYAAVERANGDTPKPRPT